MSENWWNTNRRSQRILLKRVKIKIMIVIVFFSLLSMIISCEIKDKERELQGYERPNKLNKKMPKIMGVIENWSYQTGFAIRSSPAVADLDGDGTMEVLVGSNEGRFYCLGLTGVFTSGATPWYCFLGSSFHTGWMDSDSDYLDDLSEDFYQTNKTNPDSDTDDLNDGEEMTLGTDPLKEDTDDDGMADGYEYHYNLNATDPADQLADPDQDGLSNLQEFQYRTNPQDSDSDADQMPDGFEIAQDLDPLNPEDGDEDFDDDGLSNAEEYLNHSNLTLPDTDNDNLLDGEEVNEYDTDPTKKDSDGDSLSDWEEIFVLQTDPTKVDTDGDGFSDGQEIRKGSDPNDPADHPLELFWWIIIGSSGGLIVLLGSILLIIRFRRARAREEIDALLSEFEGEEEKEMKI